MSNEIAILMAAGLGVRMRPLTQNIPKPLVKIHGVPMIETVIEALVKRGVDKIYVVVGYLGEQFGYLIQKYKNVSIVENKEYETINNISSIHVALDYMRGMNCFICEADLYIPNPMILNAVHKKSCYYGKLIQGYSDDWVFDVDRNDRITRIGKGGENCYNMCGVSYFLKSDAMIIADAVDEIWGKKGFEGLFWDEVVNKVLDRVDMEVHPVEMGDIVEIDTVKELCLVDSSYK